MNTIYLNNNLKERFEKMRMNYNQKCMRKFLKRRFSHINSDNIRAFYLEVNEPIDEKLYEIKYYSSFAFYLYLYLKSNATGYLNERPDEFTISQPIKINFTRIAQKAGISINTVKSAFKELVNLGIAYSDATIPLCNNKVKECMILNSKYIIGYDENEHKIIYSIGNK